MSFGGTPWQRNGGSYQQGGPQSMYMQQYGQSQMASSNMYSSSSNSLIAYPTGGSSSGRMNSGNYSSGSGGGGGGGGGPSSQHYNSIGTVTKISSDCGLVNDDVIFYRNVIKGSVPKLGDRVLFEASYSVTGQYEWVASRIQIIAQGGVPPLMGSTGKGSVSDYARNRLSPRRSSPNRSDFRREDRRDRERIRSRDREDEQLRKRRREDHDRSRERPGPLKKDQNNIDRKERDRAEREREQRERERDARELRERTRVNRERAERSPHRESNKGRRAAGNRRYMVQVPKNVLVYKAADIHFLRQRYANLYIPSDFFYARMKWSETFTPDNPFSLRRPCQFHIKHVDVDPPFERKMEDLEPADADLLYSAKVMLLSLPTLVEMYQKCLESDDDDGAVQKLHPSRLISFLVGTRGHNEPLAIGGPWSPSLDGENPEEDPAVLIRTAIRTCRALSGIDLSNCTQWYRFVEFYYHRTEYKNKSKSNKDNKEDPPRVETVVIYLPDIHSCMPSTSEWEQLRETYKRTCEEHIARKNAAAKANAAKAAKENEEKNSTSAEDGDTKLIAEGDGCKTDAKDADNSSKADKVDAGTEDGTAGKSDAAAAVVAENSEPMAVDGDDNKNEKDDKPEPSHYSKLDLKTMKLQQIRDELNARGLQSKGAKNALVGRLAKALAQEQEDEENAQNEADQKDVTAIEENGEEKVDQSEKQYDEDLKNENTNTNDGGDIDMNDMVVVDEYDSNKQEEPTKEMDEREKAWLTRRFTLPDTPYIVVHPNKHAKGGKFDCTTMTLQSLLNYLPGDSKERCFEVYVFAELFNEMLMRDFGFNIYKEIYFSKEPTTESNENSDKKSETNDKQENGTDEKPKEGHNSEDTDEKSGKGKTTKDKEKEKEKEKVEKKMVIVKPHLLLSFVYFDTSQCGSIFEKDMEELFSTLGLDLSRGQIRKTLSKLGAIKSFHYRKLTDREEAINAEPVIEDLDDIPADEFKDFALGNKIYGLADEEYWEGERTNATTEEGMVNFNGTIVHVAKLMEQINRTEKNYTDIHKLYSDLLKQHNDLQKDHSRGQIKVKDLLADVKSLSRKLSDSNSEISSINRKYRDQHSTLQLIYNRVQPYFSREKDRDSKSDNAKDKEIKEDKDKKKDIKENGKESKNSKEKEKDESKDEKNNAEVTSIKSETSDKTDKSENAEKVEAKAEVKAEVKPEVKAETKAEAKVEKPEKKLASGKKETKVSDSKKQ